jgi:hypothetical protein
MNFCARFFKREEGSVRVGLDTGSSHAVYSWCEELVFLSRRLLRLFIAKCIWLHLPPLPLHISTVHCLLELNSTVYTGI